MADPAPRLRSILIAIAPEQIALFKSIVESYDNLATLRTEDPARHYMRIYFGEDQAADVEQLLESLGAQFSIRVVG
ncbi:MAG TPA: DUF4911 domain-containing protein [Candidatus Binataceae bacterium]|nr:DUF4911 domain-containing protein [Candidatus Binataceae bacterium]